MGTAWVGTQGWTLTYEHDRLRLSDGRDVVDLVGADARRVRLSRRWLRTRLLLDGTVRCTLRGRDRPAVQAAMDRVAARGVVGATLEEALARRAELDQLLATQLRDQRWVARDVCRRLVAGLPTSAELSSRLTAAEYSAWAADLHPREAAALAFLGADHLGRVADVNEQILGRELVDRREFFARVEKAPLTDEQAAAVVALDNRLLVTAAAGSGKTSVMVARAAYAVDRGFVPAERILMLAFNADAADELRTRVAASVPAIGPRTALPQVSTFHAFGLALIGRATGRKPRVASWVENGQDLAKVEEIVEALRASSPRFRDRWDRFRLLYSRVATTPDGDDRDGYDRATGRTGYETYRGEVVRSHGERLIADWLFLNGVDYRYEHPYVHDVADARHGQYRPDFYYPAAGVWHEHWGLAPDGSAPASFGGYAEAMQWKRRLHAHYGTTLVETTSHEILDGRGLDALARVLRAQGVEMHWDPDRPIPGARPLENARLAQLVRTFMSHVKANSVTRHGLEQLLHRSGMGSVRTVTFVELYWQIHERWEADLRAAGAVDFDDMLIHAAELVERDPTLAHYELVMVDEFQDTSRVRARLVKALLDGRPDSFLMAVGDDWQAINRFAGADLSVMTDFANVFGPAEVRPLQTTFRCPRAIADVSSRFISRNPAQLSKKVSAVRDDPGPAVGIVRVASAGAIPDALERHLDDLARSAPGSSVHVLARYGFERRLLRTRPSRLDVTFRTVHRSKGLEADFVVLPHVVTGTYGFPGLLSDDPLLQLVMAGRDDYPHSEERRLFYVALTRARRAVTIFTVAGLESPFVVELLDDPDVVVESPGSARAGVVACPGCHQGTLVERTGRYGPFLGCSRFPACRETTPVRGDTARHVVAPRRRDVPS